jgi:hypothetical protein
MPPAPRTEYRNPLRDAPKMPRMGDGGKRLFRRPCTAYRTSQRAAGRGIGVPGPPPTHEPYHCTRGTTPLTPSQQREVGSGRAESRLIIQHILANGQQRTGINEVRAYEVLHPPTIFLSPAYLGEIPVPSAMMPSCEPWGMCEWACGA